MRTTSDVDRERLQELMRTDRGQVIEQYRQVAHLASDDTLPIDIAEMIDAIVSCKDPIKPRSDDRWR